MRSMMSRETGSRLKKIGEGMKRIRITREAEKMIKNRKRKEALNKPKDLNKSTVDMVQDISGMNDSSILNYTSVNITN